MTGPVSAEGSLNILVATPAYGGMIHCSYVHNILQLQAAGLPFQLFTIGNESLITRARNHQISWFHSRPDFSHILFLDADVSLPPEALAMMIEQDADVVGAPVALKTRGPNGSRIFNFGALLGEQGSAWKVDRIGTAALMLSRKAVNALVDDAIQDGQVYEPNKKLWDAPTWSEIHYDIFQVGVVDGEYLSEDFWVCRSLRRLGFDIIMVPDALTHHFGTVST